MASDIVVETLHLKVRELLNEVQLDYLPAFTNLVDDTVSAIKDAICRIPDCLQVGASEAPGFVNDIGADKVEFKFKKPNSIEVGGSYAFRCIVKPDVNVDLFLRLPKECFHEKDYLKNRYHGKRFLYLCIIKKYLKSSSLLGRIEWSALQNEARKPILVVYPASAPAEIPGFCVRIIPTASTLFANVAKLNATRNNIHLQLKGDVSEPTPKYNCSILEDMLMEELAVFVRETFLKWKELGEALILLKVWARQRTSIYSHDCLNGYLLAILMAYLAKEAFNKSMNALQIFRVTLKFIATSKLWNNGLSLWLLNDANTTKEEMKERKKNLQCFPVVICDPSGYFNLAFRLSKNGFTALRNEAALTIDCLEKCRGGGFEETFLTKVDFPMKYDYCVRLNLKGNAGLHASGYCMNDECWRLYEENMHHILSQGLSDRVKLIRVFWRNWISNHHVEDGFSSLDEEPLLVGIAIDTLDKSLRIVDIGPDAENKEEVARFRKFWGDKSELRRFKDGRIAESTVWECKQWERHLIIKRIIEYILSRHLSLSKEFVTVTSDQLDFSLTQGSEDPISSSGSLLEAYEVLAKRLRLLKDIPLSISSVQPLDSAFRFTSAFPPEPHPLIKETHGGVSKSEKLVETCIQPLEVMIQLEGSGNWPMDSVATEKTKNAFLLNIGESLESNWGMSCIATEDTVDVLFSGFAFRLRILHNRGLNLLKGQSEGNQVKRVSSADKALFLRSQHSSMISGLQGRYPVYGHIVRIAKRWAASHLFSACLVDEVIELLVAHLFLKPWPFNAPRSRITGFLRFLRLLSEYDWRFYPLIVDVNSDLTPEDEKEIDENFLESRKVYEDNPQSISCAMFLATPYDKQSEAWSSLSPNMAELKRLVAYARSSGNLLTQLILQHQSEPYGWERIFRTPLNNYDAVVLLHGDKLAHPHRSLFPSEVHQGIHVVRGTATKDFYPFLVRRDIKGSLDELKRKLMVDFDPLKCYLADLERKYPDTFKLWYDTLGGDAIGLTWNEANSKKRGREEDRSEDIIEMLKSVGETGKGLVRGVHLLKAPKTC